MKVRSSYSQSQLNLSAKKRRIQTRYLFNVMLSCNSNGHANVWPDIFSRRRSFFSLIMILLVLVLYSCLLRTAKSLTRRGREKDSICMSCRRRCRATCSVDWHARYIRLRLLPNSRPPSLYFRRPIKQVRHLFFLLFRFWFTNNSALTEISFNSVTRHLVTKSQRVNTGFTRI